MVKLLLLLIISLLLLVPSFSISTGIQISLTHVDSKLNLTKSKLLQCAFQIGVADGSRPARPDPTQSYRVWVWVNRVWVVIGSPVGPDY